MFKSNPSKHRDIFPSPWIIIAAAVILLVIVVTLAARNIDRANSLPHGGRHGPTVVYEAAS